MSCYNEFKKIVEIIGDDNGFTKELESLMVYLKMTGTNISVNEDSIFDWMAIIDDGGYPSYRLNDDILYYGEWDKDELDTIKLKTEELISIFYMVLESFTQKTQLTVYFEWDEESHCAYLDFRPLQVLDLVLEWSTLKEKVS